MLVFDFARKALVYLVQSCRIEEIFIPYYLCDVIRHSLVKAGCKPIFYHIDDNFMPVEKFSLDSFIVYPNYFGICSYNVDKLVSIYPNLIVDNAHAFYAEPQGFASFNSSRKFLVEDAGAFLWIGKGENGYFPDSYRREVFDKFHEIYGKTNNLNIHIKDTDIPFCYPYLAATVEEADRLVESLIAEGKVIYRYWNNLPKSFNEYKFYSRLVPIPLD